MVYQPQKAQKRQIILGQDIDGCEVAEQSPASSSVDVGAGFFNNYSTGQEYTRAAQVAGPFAVVTAPGRYRWDLVYLDSTGTVAVEQGAEQVAPVVAYTGAPGSAGPFAAADVYPLAYVLVDEAAGVVVNAADIVLIRGYMRNSQKGVVGSLATDNNAGAAGVLGTNWTRAPIDHQHPPNIDAVNPANVAEVAGPGASFVYARRDHVHALAAGLQLAMAKSTTCLWTPYDNSAAGNPGVLKWVLHRFQGKAMNDAEHWFSVHNPTNMLTLTLWQSGGPGGTGADIGLGWADDTDPVAVAVTNSWLYVYIIGIPYTTTYSIVYSTNPPSVGPGLTNAAFAGPGYTVWRLVTCIETSATAKIMVAARKFDELVIKEWFTGTCLAGNTAGHAEALYWAANFGPAAVSLAEHVSPLAICAIVNWMIASHPDVGGTQVDFYVGQRPATIMGRQDRPDALGLEYYKHMRSVNEAGHANALYEYDCFHCPLDENRVIEVTIVIVNAGRAYGQVVGYLEQSDMENVADNWSP